MSSSRTSWETRKSVAAAGAGAGFDERRSASADIPGALPLRTVAKASLGAFRRRRFHADESVAAAHFRRGEHDVLGVAPPLPECEPDCVLPDELVALLKGESQFLPEPADAPNEHDA